MFSRKRKQLKSPPSARSQTSKNNPNAPVGARSSTNGRPAPSTPKSGIKNGLKLDAEKKKKEKKKRQADKNDKKAGINTAKEDVAQSTNEAKESAEHPSDSHSRKTSKKRSYDEAAATPQPSTMKKQKRDGAGAPPRPVRTPLYAPRPYCDPRPILSRAKYSCLESKTAHIPEAFQSEYTNGKYLIMRTPMALKLTMRLVANALRRHRVNGAIIAETYGDECWAIGFDTEESAARNSGKKLVFELEKDKGVAETLEVTLRPYLLECPRLFITDHVGRCPDQVLSEAVSKSCPGIKFYLAAQVCQGMRGSKRLLAFRTDPGIKFLKLKVTPDKGVPTMPAMKIKFRVVDPRSQCRTCDRPNKHGARHCDDWKHIQGRGIENQLTQRPRNMQFDNWP
ncbi:hypothetical protein LOZ58_001586 [Ophidiomyces ophidiicola]|nr:hypothetical protein LOZ58_001586 [Ophidiomyces ophidiicola]